MTDREIIATLEIMGAEYNGNFSNDVLALIKRQQAEINRLKGLLVDMPCRWISDEKTINDIAKEMAGENNG